jgi:orotate phosphoribosyltransferase
MASLMQRLELARAIKERCLLRGQFHLRSGRTSEVYWDKYRFESDPVLLAGVAEVIVPLLPADVTALAGLEMGGIPLATAISLRTGMPTLFVRKAAKEYGTCRQIEGGYQPGERIVLIEDVVTSGGAVCDAIAAARREGLVVAHVACAIDREQGARLAFSELGCELRTAFTMAELETA